ncbi:unnamed protein product [Linum trigynum]|uniref:Uncharacterized protein n=1 Tax=Linum trigynum TaxID=586398 RepID=A0AAV2FJV4_9ROSI
MSSHRAKKYRPPLRGIEKGRRTRHVPMGKLDLALSPSGQTARQRLPNWKQTFKDGLLLHSLMFITKMVGVDKEWMS